ncbi:MAG: hypothetical protein ACK58C_05060 [Betaproteobacteria bacterium]
MSAYWIDFARILWPGFLWMSISAFPLAIGTGLAAIHLRRGKFGPYRRNLWSSTTAGIVALGLLWGSLFGGDLSSSSTAGLIFLFVPIYSAIGLGIGYVLGALAHRKATADALALATEPALSRRERRFVAVPIALLAVLLFGMLKQSVQNNEMEMAERATNPETLRQLHQKVLNGTADSFGVPLFFAQNPSTPSDILEGLGKHDHVSVRIFVARHPNASQAVLSSMINDCDSRIREEARARVQRASASNSALQPTPNCGAAERKR